MDATYQDDHPVDLRQYLAVVRQRKWTIIVVTLLVTALALAYSFNQTSLYKADASLLVKPIPTNESVAAFANLVTEAQLVESLAVKSLVQSDLEEAGIAGELDGELSVEAISESEVLIISFTSPIPAIAQAAANSYAASYIEYKQETARRALLAAQRTIQRQIDKTLANLRAISDALREARADADPAEVATLETQRTTLTTRLGILQQRLDDVSPDRAISLGGGEIIQPAALPASPVSPNPTRDAVLGAMFGLILGLVAAFIRDRLDDRFRGRADLERILGAPVLVTVPRFKASRRKKGSPADIVVVSKPKGGASEAYRTLRTNLQFMAKEGGLQVFLLTSATSSEGKTVTTANLGVALSQTGKRVILLSADLRRPTLERYFGVSRKIGLTSWLLGEVDDLWPLFLATGHRKLRILPSGPIPANPAELLASPRMPDLLATLREHCDFLLIDSTPALGLADAVIMSGHADAVLLVVDASATSRSSISHVKQELEHTGAPILGAVLNSLDPGNASYYGYGSYYSSPYTQSEGDESEPEGRKKRLRAL